MTTYKLEKDTIRIDNKLYYWFEHDRNIGDIEHVYYPTGVVPYICFSKQLIGKTEDGRRIYRANFTALHSGDQMTKIIIPDRR